MIAKWELYNLANDRCETVDLIESKPELAKEIGRGMVIMGNSYEDQSLL
jgi:hypothetical protein